MDELLTIPEVAKILRRHPKTVRRWVRSGELRAVVLGSRSIRFRARDLEEFLERHATKAGAAS